MFCNTWMTAFASIIFELFALIRSPCCSSRLFPPEAQIEGTPPPGEAVARPLFRSSPTGSYTEDSANLLAYSAGLVLSWGC
eukprot:364814-Chlamydomonas_euryale.AAC.12